jgi:hypothetical protein
MWIDIVKDLLREGRKRIIPNVHAINDEARAIASFNS